MSRKMYNPEIKERFLNTYENEDTRNTIKYVFFNSEATEDLLEKDLYDFNEKQIEKVIKDSNPLNVTIAKSTGRFISQYIKWAIEEYLRKDNMNPLQNKDDLFYVPLVTNSAKIHYSFDEFIELLEKLPNAQDQALLVFLWEGLKLEEISQIHYNDINWNENKITIRERNGEEIELDNRFMRYIENAYKAQTLISYKDDGTYVEKDLLASDYLFKNIRSTRAKEGNPVSNAVFYGRLVGVKDYADLQYMTPNSLKQSGQIALAAKLYREFEKLEYEQFEIIGNKYKVSKMTAGEYSYFNTTLMKEYISESNLKELYNIDIKY